MALRTALKAGQVVFRRIRGKIIPIAKGAGEATKKAATNVRKKASRNLGKKITVEDKQFAMKYGAGGVILGPSVGMGVAGMMNREKVKDLFKKSGTSVDSKAYVKKTGIKNVTVITGRQDVAKIKGLSFRQKIGLERAADMASSGKNAFATRIKKKDFILVGKKTQADIIGHELGHIKDFRKRGMPGFFDTGVTGSLLGRTLKMEKRAWKASPEKKQKGKKIALGTYERAQTGARAGLGVAVASGVGLLLRKKFGF